MKSLTSILAILLLIVSLQGCMTTSTINQDLQSTATQAYNDWKQQKAIADTLPSGKTVKPSEYKTPQNQLPVIKGKINLNDAIKLALQYNRNIQTAVENESYAHGRIVQAYGGVVPTATINGGYNHLDKVAEFDIGGHKFKAGALQSYNFQLHIQQPLINGAAAAGLRAAKLYKALTHKQVQNVSQNVIYGVEQSYYQLLLLQKQYRVNKQFLHVSETSLQDVQNKAKFGTATNFNVLRAKVDVANAKTQMIQSKNNLEQAQAAFYNLLGVSQNSEVNLQDSLNYKPVDTNEGKAISKALHDNPELASSLLQVRLQRQNVLASYSRYLPTVSAYLNQEYNKPNPHGSPFNPPDYYKFGYAWNAGLTLNWSIFNLSREGTIMQDKSQYRQQEISFLNDKEQILYDVHSALLGIKNAAQSVNAQKMTLKQAQEGLRLAQAGYKNGTLDQVSVLDSRQALRQAELSYYNSIYQHKVAYLKLQKATGQLKVKAVKNEN